MFYLTTHSTHLVTVIWRRMCNREEQTLGYFDAQLANVINSLILPIAALGILS